MKETQNKLYARRVHTVIIIVLVVSFYITGLLNVVASANFNNMGLKTLIHAFFHTSATIVIFPITIAISTIIAAHIIHKEWQNNLYSDKMDRDFNYSKEASPYGDAHFMEPWEYSEIAQIRPVDKCKGKVLGQIGDDGSECIDFNPYDGRLNNHMLAIGQSGGGKTFTFVKPFMYQAVKQRHSLILTDPDGGLYEDTAGYFRDNGYVVRKLDLKNLSKSDGWHCLSCLQGENLNTNVMIFSKTVVSNISDTEDIYSTASNSLLSALVLRVLLGHDYPPEEKNIRSVYQLLQNPAGLEYLETMFDKDLLTDDEMACLPPYMAFKQASDRLAANIATHLANGLQLLQNDLLCQVLSTDDIDLTLPGRELCIYYCQFPDSHNTFKFIVSLFFSMIFISLTDYADLHTLERKLPVPVDFLLDEFPSIGIIPDWSTKISVLRKRAINCIMIIQDITQLQQRYKETWNTIINNCGTIVTLGVNEPIVTAKWLSDRIGDVSIEVESTSEAQVIGRRSDLTTRSSKGVGRRSLLSPAEICKIIRDGSLILFANNNPIYARKTPHKIFKDSKNLYVTKPQNVLDINDTKGRALLHECENQYREEFWKTHEKFPDLHIDDLSDALYLDPPDSPLSMFFSVIRDDYKAIKKFVNINILHKTEKTDEDSKNISSNSAISDLAEKGAFNEYYRHFLEEHNMPTDHLVQIKEEAADNIQNAEEAEVSSKKEKLFCRKNGKKCTKKAENTIQSNNTNDTITLKHSNVQAGNFNKKISVPLNNLEDELMEEILHEEIEDVEKIQKPKTIASDADHSISTSDATLNEEANDFLEDDIEKELTNSFFDIPFGEDEEVSSHENNTTTSNEQNTVSNKKSSKKPPINTLGMQEIAENEKSKNPISSTKNEEINSSTNKSHNTDNSQVPRNGVTSTTTTVLNTHTSIPTLREQAKNANATKNHQKTKTVTNQDGSTSMHTVSHSKSKTNSQMSETNNHARKTTIDPKANRATPTTQNTSQKENAKSTIPPNFFLKTTKIDRTKR